MPIESTTWRKRAIALGFGAVLSALFALAARAAVPTGGHDYLRGLAVILGMAVGWGACLGFVVSLCVHLVRWASFKRRGMGGEDSA